VSELWQGKMQLRFVHLEEKQRAVDADRAWNTHGGEHECALFASGSARGSIDFSRSGRHGDRGGL
jgi:hypothetical protein